MPFIFSDELEKICSYCNDELTIDNRGKILQCNHCLHNDCIQKMIVEKFGDELGVVTADKSKIPDFEIVSKIQNIMMLGTKDTSGIICCPTCDEAYSIFSPIFREFGIPKKIDSIVYFLYKDEIIFHHLCTNIDVIHLLNYADQKKILSEFEYEKEECEEYQNIIKNSYQVREISGFVNHAIINHNNNFRVVSKDKCESCKNEHSDTESNCSSLFSHDEFNHSSFEHYLMTLCPQKSHSSSVSSIDSYILNQCKFDDTDSETEDL